MPDFDFHPALTEPFYLVFMGCNVVHLDDAKKNEVLRRFRQALPRYDKETLEQMLLGNWRPSKVAAWVVAAERRRELLPLLCRRMHESPHYTEHFCVALARLGGPKAVESLAAYVGGRLTDVVVELARPHRAIESWVFA
ncbi:MAG: DUF6000 family protein, partial [Acidobacteriota bacterium]